MNRIYKTLNYVETPLLTWGNPLDNSKHVIICITGNPGISDFYMDFATELFTNTSIPVCVIGQAGHEKSVDKNKRLFNLMDQLEHKLDLIENHIHKNSKIHLIGHSIGAWLILELLHKHSNLIEKVSSINLLFPTLHKMAESNNGKFVNNLVRKVNPFILFLSKLLYILPKKVLNFLVGIYLWVMSLPYKLNSTIIELLNPDILENIFYLAFNEMDTVLSLNTQCLQNIKHLTNVVYTSKDNWAPIKFMEDLKQFQPDLQMTEAHNVEHAFVLKSSEVVATIVADFINTKINR